MPIGRKGMHGAFAMAAGAGYGPAAMSNDDMGRAPNGSTNQGADASTPFSATAPGATGGSNASGATGPATSAEPGEARSQEGGPEAEIAALRDKYLRTAADFDNFRKRTRREVDDAERRGREVLLRELLPVFDNLERALQVANQATDVRAVAEGIGMVLRQFGDTLERANIRRVSALGEPFDPTMHEAVQQIETRDQAPGTIVAEVQPGYVSGDKLVRAALVVVAKAPASG
jgi:molecular chaperone GrpE